MPAALASPPGNPLPEMRVMPVAAQAEIYSPIAQPRLEAAE